MNEDIKDAIRSYKGNAKIEDTAQYFGVSPSTVSRCWRGVEPDHKAWFVPGVDDETSKAIIKALWDDENTNASQIDARSREIIDLVDAYRHHGKKVLQAFNDAYYSLRECS